MSSVVQAVVTTESDTIAETIEASATADQDQNSKSENSSPSFFVDFRRSVSQKIESMTTKDEVLSGTDTASESSEGFFVGIRRSVAQKIDSVLDEGEAKASVVHEVSSCNETDTASESSEGFFVGIRRSVAQKIDSVLEEGTETLDSVGQRVDRAGDESQGFFDEIRKKIDAALDEELASDSMTPEDSDTNVESEPREGFFSGIRKKIDAVLEEDVEGQQPEGLSNGATQKPEGFLGGLMKSVSNTLDSVTKEESNAPASPRFLGGIIGIFDKPRKSIDLSVLGATGSGKSALVKCFITGNVVTEYEATIEDQYKKEEGGCEYKITDTTGSLDHQNLLSRWISGKQAFILVFSLTSSTSFEDLRSYADSIYRSTTPLIIVGTHADKRDERVILRDQAEDLAEEWNCPYLEITTQDPAQVFSVFQTLSSLINLN
eukprot:TRINITY_DN1439_c0_g1_i1.p1 TRINITY_DN1439_c0_g1~~TRINITY_DN1439_c0_g1_i1.p1  ORF type:complete len:433 (-),score=68.09 TRINITY_DN1439_c0_g1_i1:26-1324(-)